MRAAADLGCGTGELTRLLLARWPAAHVWGVDLSAAMLGRAPAAGSKESLKLVRADLRRWTPPESLDLVISNAALHWVSDHRALLRRLASLLAPEGVLAVQIPNNRAEAAYGIADRILSSLGRELSLPEVGRSFTIAPPSSYLSWLDLLGLDADLWETIYYHTLPDPAAIVEWLKGTTLRPVLTSLSPAEGAVFLERLAPEIARAYPAGPAGVIFPFRRLFFVARKRR